MRNAYLLVTATFEPFPKVPACGTEWGINCSTMCTTGFYPSMGSWLAWSAATPFWYARRRSRRSRRCRARPRPTWCRSAGRAQRVRRQRIVIARVGGAGAAGHDWYTMRLNHVLTFEQQKSMLAWGKQTLIEHMHCRGHSGVRSIVGVSFVVRKCYSPCFCSEARCGRDGPSAYV